MSEELLRTKLLIGDEGLEKLHNAKVAVFGVGGVGGYVVEALARSGIGSLTIVDDDVVAPSNINRQIIALHSTIGKSKVQVMKDRIHDINPEIAVDARQCFYLPETAAEFDFSEYSYIVDAVDTVTAKLEIIMQAKDKKIPVISSMGTGNKLDPSRFCITDIYKTEVCPLAKVMRQECRKRGIKKLKVLYSPEIPIKNKSTNVEENSNHAKRSTPGSIAFVPPTAGLLIAGEVVNDILKGM